MPKKYSKSIYAVNRRKRTLTRLETQLSTGTKTTKEGPIPLEPKDKTRIQTEIETLKTRV